MSNDTPGLYNLIDSGGFIKKYSNQLVEVLEVKEFNLRRLRISDPGSNNIPKLESEIRNLRKVLNKSLSKYNIDAPANSIINPNFEPEDGLKGEHLNYREKREESNLSIQEIKEASELNTVFEGKDLPKRVIIRPATFNPGKEVQKDPLSDFLNGNKSPIYYGPAQSTPIRKSRTGLKLELNFELTQNNIEIFPEEQTIKIIKENFSGIIPGEYIDTYFEKEEAVREFEESIKEGRNFLDVLGEYGHKILEFIKKIEKDNLSLTQEYLSAIENTGENKNNIVFDLINSEGKEINEEKMVGNASTHVRGLSIKDALDLIPRYNGSNMKLSQFLDGCRVAKKILPGEAEQDLARLIQIRLYGEALNASMDQEFQSIEEIETFLGNIFDAVRTYFEVAGELASTKQGRDESVVSYLTKIRNLEKELEKATYREKKDLDKTILKKDVEADCIRVFIKGLRWEIRIRMGAPDSWDKAREQALSAEREFSGPDMDRDRKKESQQETREINIIEANIECNYCKKKGHGLLNCFKLDRDKANLQRDSLDTGQFSRNQERNLNFTGFNGDNNYSRDDNASGNNWDYEDGPNNNRGNLYGNRNHMSYGNFGQNRGFNNGMYMQGRNFNGDQRNFRDNRDNNRNFDYNARNGYAVNDNRNTSGQMRNGKNYSKRINREQGCFYCGQTDHRIRDCQIYLRDSGQNSNTSSGHQEEPAQGNEQAPPMRNANGRGTVTAEHQMSTDQGKTPRSKQ